jgi:predicted nucleic acid-binding protein
MDTQIRLQQALLALPIHIDPASIQRDWSAVLPLSLQAELSSYDAAYLELALRENIPLATFDAVLRAKAAGLGITCL